MVSTNVLLSPENQVVYQRLLQRVRAPPGSQQQAFEEHVLEFGHCRYWLVSTGGPDSKLQLSFSLPELDSQYSSQLLGQQAIDLLAASLKGVATLAPAQKGYHVTVDVDTKLMARLSSQQQELWARTLASMRLLLVGHPLRAAFKALEAATLQPGPAQPCSSMPGQVYFVKPAADSVTAIFPMSFSSSQDAAIGHTFLQEFVEARRGPALGRSPVVNYYPPRDGGMAAPPGELAGVDVKRVLSPGAANGGWLVFAFSARHIAGPQMEGVVWSMCTLYHFITYHLTAAKTMMHTHMRKRVEVILSVLAGSSQ